MLAGIRASLAGEGVDRLALFPHWELGPLTLGEWLAFLVLHEERHAVRIERLLRTP